MRSEKKIVCSIILLIVMFVIMIITGWGMNIYKFIKCDFKEPYKAEVIRGIGIFILPVGGVLGYLKIQD